MVTPCWAVNSRKDDLSVMADVAPAEKPYNTGSIKRIDKVNVRQGFKKKEKIENKLYGNNN